MPRGSACINLIALVLTGPSLREAYIGLRNAVRHVQDAKSISERRACKVLEQPRSTQRYQSTKLERDRPLVKRMHELAEENPRAGYRLVTHLLRGEGWRSDRGPINPKYVHRLWKQAGLQVPQQQHKRRREGEAANGCTRLKARYPGHVWSVDFLFDT